MSVKRTFAFDIVSMDGYVITKVTIQSVKLFVAIRKHNLKYPICSEKVLLCIIKRFEETVMPFMEIR